MKLILLTLFILSFSLCAYCQLPEFEIYIHDTIYMDKTLFMTKGNKDIYSWRIKHNLKKGKYYVYDSNECGKDTLKYAEFSADGVKSGEWKEWDRRLCGELLNENLTSKNKWSFSSEKNDLSGVSVYEHNFIVETQWLFERGKPSIVNFYPESAEEQSDWSRMVVYREDGTYKFIQTKDSIGNLVFMEYDEEGNVKSIGKSIDKDTEVYSMELYYPKGEVWAKGESTTKRVENGLWTYWDENGKIIAKVNFDKGKIIDYKRFQNKEITPAYIDELVLPIKE